jgi:hypothetical protein
LAVAGNQPARLANALGSDLRNNLIDKQLLLESAQKSALIANFDAVLVLLTLQRVVHGDQS